MADKDILTSLGTTGQATASPPPEDNGATLFDDVDFEYGDPVETGDFYEGGAPPAPVAPSAPAAPQTTVAPQEADAASGTAMESVVGAVKNMRFVQAPAHGSQNDGKPDPVVEIPEGCTKVMRLAWYQAMFDVDTIDVIQRIMRVATFWKGDFIAFCEAGGKGTDLWAPFWLTTTVVFLLGAIGNLISFIRYVPPVVVPPAVSVPWAMDFDKITLAAGILYSYLVAMPCVVKGLSWLFDTEIEFLDLVCLYGYSMSPMVIEAVLACVPLNWFIWATFLVAMAFSLGFLLFNTIGHFKGKVETKNYYIIVAVIAIAHIAFSLPLKMFVLTY